MSDVVDDQTEQDQEQTEPSGATSPADPSSLGAAVAEHGDGDQSTDGTSTDERGTELGEIDVAGIEADLDGVQAALTRLADGTYWTDEVTGDAIPADVLDADPLARRA